MMISHLISCMGRARGRPIPLAAGGWLSRETGSEAQAGITRWIGRRIRSMLYPFQDGETGGARSCPGPPQPSRQTGSEHGATSAHATRLYGPQMVDDEVLRAVAGKLEYQPAPTLAALNRSVRKQMASWRRVTICPTCASED